MLSLLSTKLAIDFAPAEDVWTMLPVTFIVDKSVSVPKVAVPSDANVIVLATGLFVSVFL